MENWEHHFEGLEARVILRRRIGQNVEAERRMENTIWMKVSQPQPIQGVAGKEGSLPSF